MKRIYLIGYMGSGKTTLGRAFARAMQMQFVDLDWYIEERFHRTIQQLFTEKGESGFREIEQSMLHEVGEFENVVVATGGGTPCFFDNMDYMKRTGDTVFLEVSSDVLFRRLKMDRANRPLLHGKTDDELMDTVLHGVENRLPFYSQAEYRFDASHLECRKEVDGLVVQLRNLLERQS